MQYCSNCLRNFMFHGGMRLINMPHKLMLEDYIKRVKCQCHFIYLSDYYVVDCLENIIIVIIIASHPYIV